ncbi:hypothetical protein Tco_1475594 [Tanacetum coccineum]
MESWLTKIPEAMYLGIVIQKKSSHFKDDQVKAEDKMERITIKEYEIESEVFDLLKIDLDLFTCDTPLGTLFDEFTRLKYERMFAEVVILMDDRLVKLIDITLEQWLDLKFRDHKKVDKEIIEGVVATWLIRSYRKQFEEYMEIKMRLKMEDDDDDIGDLDDYLIPNNASYYVDEDEERFKERRSKLLGISYEKPPTIKSEKFDVIKYSFAPAE